MLSIIFTGYGVEPTLELAVIEHLNDDSHSENLRLVGGHEQLPLTYIYELPNQYPFTVAPKSVMIRNFWLVIVKLFIYDFILLMSRQVFISEKDN